VERLRVGVWRETEVWPESTQPGDCGGQLARNCPCEVSKNDGDRGRGGVERRRQELWSAGEVEMTNKNDGGMMQKEDGGKREKDECGKWEGFWVLGLSKTPSSANSILFF